MVNKKRLIDLEKAIETVWGTHWLNNNEKGIVQTLLRKLPTVDAVQIVRCRDCAHWKNEHGYTFCKVHSTLPDQYGPGATVYMEPEDFCSYGERRCDNDPE